MQGYDKLSQHFKDSIVLNKQVHIYNDKGTVQ